MKNLLNRLTRFMIIMLMLVDRTPFLNVYAANDKSTFTLRIDINGTINQGCGVGQYDLQGDLDDSLWNPALQNDSGYLRSLVLAVIGSSHPYANFVYSLADVKIAGDDLTNVCVDGPVNIAPTAVNDVYATAEDVDLTVLAIDGVLKNDSDANGEPMTAVLVSTTTSGALTLNIDGSFFYDPNLNFNGTDSFTYKVVDLRGFESNIATVTINIGSVNDAPVGANDSFTIPEGGTEVGTVGDLASDVDGGDLDFVLVSGPAFNGTAFAFNTETGAYTYVHDGSENFATSFTYKVTDGTNESPVYTVSITITPVNDNAPVGANDSFTIPEGGTEVGTLADLASDVDGGDLDFVLVSGPAFNGTAFAFNTETGAYTYVHDGSENFATSFTYKVTDGTNESPVYTVSITITEVNEAPTGANDSFTILEGGTEVGTLADLVSDPEDDDLTFNLTSGPAFNGTAFAFNTETGAYTYVHDGSENFATSFKYTVSDGEFTSPEYTVSITITPVNDRPVAQGDEVTTPEDVEILIEFVASDEDGDTLIYGIIEGPQHGTLTGSGDSRTYTPDKDFVGDDSFIFGVSDRKLRASAEIKITVTAVNDAPVAVSNLYTIDEDTDLVEAAPGVLGNDTDVEDSPLTANLVDGPSFATSFTLNSDGSFTYTPIVNFSGLDTFTYKANDGELDSNVATVTISVNPIEDAPVAVDDPDVESEIEAFEKPEDTPLVLSFEDLLGNDYDPDDEVFFQPQMFRVLLMPVYSFDFNTAFSPSVGTLSLDMTGRTVTFTPPLNYVGPAQFEYTIIDEDDNVSEPATVFIEVIPVNDAPVASPLAFTIANAGSSTGQLVASDVDDTALVFSLLASPTNGSATVSSAGVYTYTHNGTATLSDSFTFSVTDGELSATAVVTVTITAAPTPPPVPVNLPPVANALAFTIANDAISTGTLSGSDPEGAPIGFFIATLPANGSLTISPAGIYVYNHNGTATTSDSFTFTVSDGSLTSTATVSITILPIPTPPPAGNTPPEVINGVVSTSFGEVLEGDVALLGSDEDGDDLSFALVDGPTNGTLVFNSDGTYTYTPNDGFDGSDSFTFIANDGEDDSNTGTLTINVLEEVVIVEEAETPLAAPDNNWLWWLLALLAGLLLWLLVFLRPNMKYTLSDKANNQKVVRRRLSKPDDKTMIVELNDKDMVGLTTIEVEFFKRLAKHCGGVNVKFMLKGTQVHSVTLPADIDDVFTTIIHL